MPQRRAAKKDLRQNKKRRQINLSFKRKTQSAIKKFKKSLENPEGDAVKRSLSELQEALDKAAGKRIIHPNKAARKKSRFSKSAKKTLSKPAE